MYSSSTADHSCVFSFLLFPQRQPEPEWRDFFETSTAVQRKRAGQSKKEKEKEKEAGKEGRVVFAATLPPITYISNEQPTTAGEAGLRCLHSIRVVEKVRI